MVIKDIIQLLEKEGTWVNWDQTRDHLLHGDDSRTVKRIGVCWMLTNQALEKAIEHHLDFIITHENPFYMASTRPVTLAHQAACEKRRKLDEHHISVYRCHDVWDCIRESGVSDMWAKRLGFEFEERNISSYFHFANIQETSSEALSLHVADALVEDGQNGVWLYGRPDKKITRLAIGTGAATNVWAMLKEKPDAVIVSEDGVSTFSEGEYLIDHDISMILVSHAACEMAGIKELVNWLKDKTRLECVYLDSAYQVHSYTSKKQRFE